MLTSVTIQNFGLIDNLALEFDPHLNILTGETGAGKSIVIDALRIALGERIQSSQLRDSTKNCVIEICFDLSKNALTKHELFTDYLTESPELIIQRTFQPDGKNKIKVNGLSLTINQLKELGKHLMDFHGAHDHQLLFSSDSHQMLLDKLIDFGKLIFNYQKQFENYAQLKQKLHQLQSLTQSRDREVDLLKHQIKELEQLPLDEKTYEELLQEQKRLVNAERLHEYLTQILGNLEEGENNPVDGIRRAFSPLRMLNQVDESTENFTNKLTEAQEALNDVAAELHSYADGLSFDPDSSRDIHKRCDTYEDICRKYGPSISEAKNFYESAKEKYQLLSNLEENNAQLANDLAKAQKGSNKIAEELSELRKKGALALKKTIEKELKELGINHVQFEARVERDELNSRGFDNITFYISPNAGEDLKPLSEIVSSGEAARVMLALKKALINVDPIPVLIFDEIDAQIGGRLGTVTGEKLKQISSIRQVILITHLPQIASYADAHFKVTKSVKNNRTSTHLEKLDKNARVKELAQMMSGQKETEISIKHAHDLLANAKK
jgi:DNA repair protein RecN (Recombination protein N)